MIHHPTLKKYHSSNLHPVGLQEIVQTRNFKILISFLGQWCKSIFWKPIKNHQKSYPTINIFWENTPKNPSKSWNSFMLHFVPEKIIYKIVKSWIQRKLLICNTWMNLDHKIISSIYHIKFPLFTKEICAPKNSC